MLTCYLQGGLGNQLFQIFTTLNYALQHKKPFAFTNQSQLDTKRATYWQTFLAPLAKFTKPIDYRQINVVNAYNKIKEVEFSYNPLPPSVQENILLVGYFQSYKYFVEHAKGIIKLIRLEEQREKARKIFNLRFNFKLTETISLHFRRGDYKMYKDSYVLLDANYYNNALNYILTHDKATATHALVFCEKNDLPEVLSIIHTLKQNFPTLIFVIIDFNMSDWLQLLGMSICKHNIIANSTFSWWGAYFNTSLDKLVCYPDRWFGPALKHNNTKDLCPPDWKEIQVSQT